MKIVTITTDFGLQDWFVGVMKGILLQSVPDVQLIDITHLIPQGDIRAAAFLLRNIFGMFPEGTVHLVVVDPGVGSSRIPIAIQTDPLAYLVGPDNGVFSYFLSLCRHWEARQIQNPEILRPAVGTTFHGRDIFAPAAAWLASGKPFEQIGPSVSQLQLFRWPEPRVEGSRAFGQIVYLDRFGNGITNLPHAIWDRPPRWAFLPDRGIRIPVRRSYSEVEVGEPVCVPGSTGFWEIAVRDGNAAEKLHLCIDLPLVLEAS